MPGPLEGVSVIELVGLGPAPFCGMVLSDLGADVIQIDRIDRDGRLQIMPPEFDLHRRGKRSIALDLKKEQGKKLALELVANADVLIEGFRPGVVERLGIGPAQALAANQKLVYGRMTGWGQNGPYSSTAGHDVDYIAIAGVLHTIGPDDSPSIPLNLIADFGGGGMLLAVGVLAALVHVRSGGVGQTVDAAMVDGSALLSTSIHGMVAAGLWDDRRSSNLLDGGAPFYAVYETSDGRHMAVGALEARFFAALIAGLEIQSCPPQHDRIQWPEMRQQFAERFRRHPQSFWVDKFSGTDACVAPILTLGEALDDPHLQARATFDDVDGIKQPQPAPRFSATPASINHGPAQPGRHTATILSDLGYSDGQISKLVVEGSVA